jgi:hypothetical protein
MAPTPMKSFPPPPQSDEFRNDLLRLLDRYWGHLPVQVIYAISAQVAGNIAAHLDSATWTPSKALDVLLQNFQTGNAAAVEQIIAEQGGRN